MSEREARRQAGARLKRALDGYWPRSRGGLRGLAEAAKIGPETLYRWFRGDSEPDLGSIRRIADATNVERWQLVAAMDLEEPPAAATVPPPWAEALDRKLDVLLATAGVDPVDAEDEAEAARLIDAALELVQHEPEGASQ